MKERLKELLEMFYSKVSHSKGAGIGDEIYTFATCRDVSLYCESVTSKTCSNTTIYSFLMRKDDVFRNISVLNYKLTIETYIDFQTENKVYCYLPQLEEPVLANFKVSNRLVGVPINDGDEVDCVEYWCDDLEVLGASKEQLEKIEKLINEKLNEV